MAAPPTGTISTANVDAAADNPALAVVQLKEAIDHVNELVAAFNTANGIAPLDVNSRLPGRNAPQADRGLSIVSDKYGHSNSINGATVGEAGKLIQSFTYDAHGHVSAAVVADLPSTLTRLWGTGNGVEVTTTYQTLTLNPAPSKDLMLFIGANHSFILPRTGVEFFNGSQNSRILNTGWATSFAQRTVVTGVTYVSAAPGRSAGINRTTASIKYVGDAVSLQMSYNRNTRRLRIRRQSISDSWYISNIFEL